MLTIIVPPTNDIWDEKCEVFRTFDGQVLRLEHSLVSISKWESKWCKPFLSKKDKTDEEILYYVKCMTLNSNVDPLTYLCLTEQNYKDINDYIDSPMTATTFRDDAKRGGSGEIVTSELIYYWMITLGIPQEYQKWHLNRLLTLIKVCNIKNQPNKNMSKREIMSRNAALNAARRKQLNTKG